MNQLIKLLATLLCLSATMVFAESYQVFFGYPGREVEQPF